MTSAWPAWLAVVAVVTLLLFGVRLLLRRWNNRVIADANRNLHLPIPAFALLNRQRVIERLLGDPQLQQLIQRQSAATGIAVDALQKQCRRYAREMVPAFKALFYFRVGYWLARALLLSHYHVHSRLAEGAAMELVDSNSSVVLVMNHRSNMDVLLVNFLASRRSTLMHAAGEWARLWPLHHLVRMAGNYVVDRDADDPVYRGLLKAYVQMAVAEGAHLAIFPEGELTRDGKMQTPKFGLLSYVATAGMQSADSDIYFIPVGVNYDYVPEEATLVFDQATAFRARGKLHLFVGSVFATAKMIYRVLRPRRAQFGNACASFGRPVSLRAWQAARADARASSQCVSDLGSELMQEVARLIPTLPTHALAGAFVDAPEKLWPLNELQAEVQQVFAALRSAGAVLCIPGHEEQPGVTDALQLLIRRKLVLVDASRRYRANPAQLPVMRYLASSVAHLTAGEAPGTAQREESTLQP